MRITKLQCMLIKLILVIAVLFVNSAILANLIRHSDLDVFPISTG